MLRFLELKGKKVMFQENIIGFIENALFDKKGKIIYSLIIKSLNEKGAVFLSRFKNIKIEKDMVLVENSIHKMSDSKVKKLEKLCLANLIGKSVIDKSLREIGSVVDIMFEEKTGVITALIVSMGFFDDLLTGRKVIILNENDLLGDEKIMVDGNNIDIINEISTKLL